MPKCSRFVLLISCGFSLLNLSAAEPTPSTSFDPKADTLRDQIKQTDGTIAGLTDQLAQFERIKAEAVLRALPDLKIKDPTAAPLLPKYQELLSQEQALLHAGVAATDPRIVQLRHDKETFVKQMEDTVATVEHSLQIQLSIMQKTRDSQVQSLSAAGRP